MENLFNSFGEAGQPEIARDYLKASAELSEVNLVRATGLAEWRIGDAERLLDVGCGNGEVAADLARRFPDAEVGAVDHSPDAIADARRRHPESRADYRVADIYDLPYPDGYFDGVRSERVLQHLTEPDRAITEMARTLRPGGRLLLIDTDWRSLLVDGSPAGFDDVATELLAVIDTILGRTGHRTVGRTLRRRMIQAGLSDVQAQPVTLSSSDLAPMALVLPLREGPYFQLRTNETASLFDRWFQNLEEAAADGTFLGTITMWVATGTR